MPQGEVVPQVLVFQEFASTPAELTAPLRAFAAGPCYSLLRYSEAAEKALIELGAYDMLSDKAYAWPNKPAGGVVDQAWAHVFFDNALLKYFEDDLTVDETIAPVAGYKNRIKCATLIFKTANEYDRSPIFLDRDVQVGDSVDLRDEDDNVLRTTIKGFVAETDPAAIGTAVADPGNKPNQSSAGPTVSELVTKASKVVGVGGGAYNGMAAGRLSETYTVKVRQGSVGSAPDTALLDFYSADGLDNGSVIPNAAWAGATLIGTRGLSVAFDVSGGSGVSDFVAGQSWQVVVAQAYVKSTPAASGTYAGDFTANYIVEVIQGGLFASNPQILVSTDEPNDSSGPTVVAASATPVDIGTKGAKIAFTGTGLVTGDRFIVPVTGPADAEIRTLILGNNMSTLMLAATDLEVKLYIKKDVVEVGADRIGAAPLVNWETTAQAITLKSGITVFDPSWTDDGDMVALPVTEATMYVQYRSLRSDMQNDVQTLTDISSVVPTLGPITADNPLALGVYLAALNSNGTAVKFMNTPNTLAGHSYVIDKLIDRKDVYGLVPLTFDPNIQDLYQGHVEAMSTPEAAGWRVAWFSTQAITDKGIRITKTGGASYLGTITEDPETPGTQYTILTCADGDFQNATNPVRAGDKIRAQYVDDGFGNMSYQTYVVDEVINNNELRLVTGPAAPISTAAKFEVHRDLTKDETAAELAIASGGFGSRRVRNVWPDTVGWNGVDIDGYYVACALAGLRSGIVPQQGMTNLELTGFDDLTRTTEFFNTTQLTTMAAAGTWIVTRADEDALNPGAVYTRQQLTTDTSTIENGEDSLVSNPDSISYLFYRRLSGRIGTNNITPSLMQLLRTEALASIEYLKQNGFNERIGGQVIDGEVARLIQHPLLKDRVQMDLNLVVPYPLNNLEIRLVFS